MIASDGFNTAFDEADSVFSVSNNAPEVSILSPVDGDLFTGVQLVFFEALATDREDGQLTGASLVWTSDRDGFLGTGGIFNLEATDLSEGNHVITLTARDREGLSAIASVNISIFRIAPPPNQLPTADAGGPYEADEGAEVILNGTGSFDPDGDPLTFDWAFGDGGTGTGGTPSHIYADNGIYEVCLTVTDPLDASATDCTTADIANVAPRVDAGADHEIFSGESVAKTISFSDPGVNDAPWAFNIDWRDGSSDGGSTSDQSTPIEASHQYFVPGEYTVTVCVTDKDAGQGCDSQIVTVMRVPVAIDIWPKFEPNIIVLGKDHPVLVAILSNPDFNAPREVDQTFLTFGRTGDEESLKFCLRPALGVNRDGLKDLLCLFRSQLAGFKRGDQEGILRGVTMDGVFLEGRDSVRVVEVKVRRGH